MKKTKFDVTGMTCSACQAHVEKAVKSLDGISAVNVNLLRNYMQVEYDENSTNSTEIISAVEKAGYGAAESPGGPGPPDDAGQVSSAATEHGPEHGPRARG